MEKCCGNCEFTDGLCYTSLPPQVKCTKTGEFHFMDDVCTISKKYNCPDCSADNCDKCVRCLPATGDKTLYDKSVDEIKEFLEEHLKTTPYLNSFDTLLSSIPPSCRGCPNHPSNGGSGICHCILGTQITY